MAGKRARPPGVWEKVIQSAPDPERTEHFLKLLTSRESKLANAAPEWAQMLAALFSGSPVMSDWLVAHPDWLAGQNPESIQYPRQAQGLVREVNQWLEPALEKREFALAFQQLRQFKHRQLLRIALRDLARRATSTEITRELSDVADVCLNAVWRLTARQLELRFGRPYHQDADGAWQPTDFAVIGLGKLGGQELNYSSDVDVVFVYSEEGSVHLKKPGPRTRPTERVLSNHQFYKRLAESFVAEVSRATAEGMLYRIDLRLRPEGEGGPLVRSLPSYENYYAQWGQTWERMMLLKGRVVAGEARLGYEFLEMVQPFRYPRSLNEGVGREVAAMKERIENEVVRAGELERNVKLGRGGIREIEFVVQTLQLLHGGRLPFLQGAQTLPTLQKLADYKLLAPKETNQLTAAYMFLRDVEHRLQMEHNLQTHTLPSAPGALARLGALMGFKSARQFENARREHVNHVRTVYDRLLGAAARQETGTSLPQQFDDADKWKKLLAGHGFRDSERAFRLWKEFIHGPGYVHVSTRTMELARTLISKMLALCPQPAGQEQPARILSDPDRVLARLDSFIGVYGARATLFETWASNPSLFELMLWLFDRSEFLAEIAIRTPDLVDELVASGRLVRRKKAVEILTDLRHGREDKDQRLWLRRYHQAEFMRIGLREIVGLADLEQNLVELSALADACLAYALEAVQRRHRCKQPPFAIIGLGKLGGEELSYGSDLDIMFVAGQRGQLPKLQKMAAEVMELLSSPTELGVAFVTDARLRPDGEKGLLVNTLAAYEDYYRHRAQLWEIQALTRARPIAGDSSLGEQFQTMATKLTNFQQPSLPLAAFTPEWRQAIQRMRHRIEKERTPAGKEALAIKTGRGGLMDAEFIAQLGSLAHGWQEANTLRALQRVREALEVAPAKADQLIENYQQLRRVEGILRRWSYEGETVLPDHPEPLYRVAVRCGFRSADAFMAAVRGYREKIRQVYDLVFPPARVS